MINVCLTVLPPTLWKLQSVPELQLQVRFHFLQALKNLLFCASPNIDRKSREQFEIRTHRRLIDILNPTGKTIDALKTLTLPAGVDIKIKAA